MTHLSALVIGFLLDCLFGDPYWLPHPIRWIGSFVSCCEGWLRKWLPSTPKWELFGGVLLVLLVSLGSAGICVVVLWLCSLVSPILSFLVECIISYQMLAGKCLSVESGKVFAALQEGNLAKARHAVSMIVGRDTQQLDETGVTKAAVETVAENTSDGVIAPMLFLALGGAPLGIFYKACNTMDSMVGYHNETYEFFGRAAAKWDDVLNFIPARISGFLMCFAAPLCGCSLSGAFHIFLRDRLNHKSPNSAHTEAACAGALGVQLAGNSYYFGKLVEKPTIGDSLRPVEPEDIIRANHLMFATSLITLLVLVLVEVVL